MTLYTKKTITYYFIHSENCVQSKICVMVRLAVPIVSSVCWTACTTKRLEELHTLKESETTTKRDIFPSQNCFPLRHQPLSVREGGARASPLHSLTHSVHRPILLEDESYSVWTMQKASTCYTEPTLCSCSPWTQLSKSPRSRSRTCAAYIGFDTTIRSRVRGNGHWHCNMAQVSGLF